METTLTASCGPPDEVTTDVAAGSALLDAIVVDVVAAMDASLEEAISGSGVDSTGSLELTSGSDGAAGSSAGVVDGASSSAVAAASMRTGGASSTGGVTAGASYAGAAGAGVSTGAGASVLGGAEATGSGRTPVGAVTSVTTGAFTNGSAPGAGACFGAGTRRYVFSITATCAGDVVCAEGSVPVRGTGAADVTRLLVAVGAACAAAAFAGTASVGNCSEGRCSSWRGTTLADAEGSVNEANAGTSDEPMRLTKPTARIARPSTPCRSAARLGSPRTCARPAVAMMPHSPRSTLGGPLDRVNERGTARLRVFNRPNGPLSVSMRRTNATRTDLRYGAQSARYELPGLDSNQQPSG